MNALTTILQVDDDPNDVIFLRRAMKKAGMTNPIQVATDGRQAINYLQGSGQFADRGKFPFPSLVLLDLKLPHVMGLDVLKKRLPSQFVSRRVRARSNRRSKCKESAQTRCFNGPERRFYARNHCRSCLIKFLATRLAFR